MSKFNEDVLYLIFKEFRNDKKPLYPCLLVNKTWCEIIVPILWKNPWNYLRGLDYKLLFDVIISHLSNESRGILRIQGVRLSEIQQKLLFNYISFCRYLNLYELEKMINYNFEMSKFSIVMNEILKLFVNRNTKITHLYIPPSLNYQIHLVPGAEYCFSELKFLHCHTCIKQNILEGLSTKIGKSIKNLIIHTYPNNDCSFEIVKLIETQESLNNVCFSYDRFIVDEPFRKTLEGSLFKHAKTIQYLRVDWRPITKILSYLVNLISLEVKEVILAHDLNWNHLENAFLPALRILKSYGIPSKSLASLIENTKGHLTEISIDFDKGYGGNKGHFQAICKNCPNLKYLLLFLKNNDIDELEGLLISCQYLEGLIIKARHLDWHSIFEILIESSPASLFKFKFCCTFQIRFEWDSIKLFLDNWKGRNPMLLQTSQNISYETYEIKKYIEEGIIKKYDYQSNNEDFEWI